MLLTELPAYLYWNAEFPRKGDGALEVVIELV